MGNLSDDGKKRMGWPHLPWGIRIRRSVIRCVAMFGACLLGLPLSAVPPRYVARTTSGSWIYGERLTAWRSSDSQPMLDDQPLPAEEGPIRWLLDRSARLPDDPQAYVEFFAGDRLPGMVELYRPKGRTAAGQTPAHFLVRTKSVSASPGTLERSEVRITSTFVRRIVWRRRRIDRYEPGHVFLRNGSSIRFRSIRPAEKHVDLLVPDGLRRVPFGQIDELHLPAVDPWQQYFSLVAVLCSRPSTLCQQIETTDGLRVTTSHERFRGAVSDLPQANGSSALEAEFHTAQPAWSFDVLWIRRGAVRLHRFWRADDVPLALFEPSENERRAPNELWPTTKNSTAHGHPLVFPKRAFGWGFGVHGPTELVFPLPAAARGFCTDVGYDRAGVPGQIDASVTAVGSWQRDGTTLTGTASSAQLCLAWGTKSSPQAQQLRLQTTPRAEQATGVIHNIANSIHWGDPRVLLDPGQLWAQLDQRTGALVEPWKDWTRQEHGRLTRHNVFLEDAPDGGSYAWCHAPTSEALVLRRRVQAPAAARWLVVDASHCGSMVGTAAEVDVWFDGHSVARQRLAHSTSYSDFDREPLAVRLPDMARQRAVEWQIRQAAGSDRPVLWRDIRFTEQHPSLHQLFDEPSDEQASFAAIEGFRGGECLRIHAEKPIRLGWKQPIAIRERPAPGEYRFLRCAFRAEGKGSLTIELGRLKKKAVLRYVAGEAVGDPREGAAKIVDELPDHWIVVTRDLFGDFGPAELVDLTLSASSAEAVFWDHCYLARRPTDFRLVEDVLGTPTSGRSSTRAD